MANYYDIGDILAEEELVPTVFQYGANGVGLFDSSDDADKVEAGSRAELPFWLVRELYLRQLVSIRVPPCFDREIRDRTIGPFLLVAFQTRYRDVLVKAHALTLTMTPKYLTLLTNEEIKLYEAGQSSIAAFKKWRMGGPRFQVAPVLGRKRKLT
ncbi:probable DNA replication complex GINS protein PSF3 isoform X3 [Salvia hispanica]|uniref:probable DNA replication complex GINS protein PSF3 isoform X3 n=1 Tax=Salvia hispanica TaxID=49212 RepID=UPI0020099183|nr:probable DNA replication complex GINS protein PSF3 isoform X3 [Salvia hispanica]